MGWIIAIVAACIGSFLNVLIYRLPRNESIALPSSSCPNCHHRLGPIDLIPIISYAFRNGKCGYCKTPISPQYVFVELLTVGIVMSHYLALGLSWEFAYHVTFWIGMLILFWTDLNTQLLPTAVMYPLLLVGTLWRVIHDETWWLVFQDMGIVAALIGGIALIARLYYKREALGTGDIILGMIFASFWGLHVALLGLYSGCIIAGIIGAVLLLTKHKKRQDELPFAPALIVGTGIALHIEKILEIANRFVPHIF